jgi:hypothetical protein
MTFFSAIGAKPKDDANFRAALKETQPVKSGLLHLSGGMLFSLRRYWLFGAMLLIGACGQSGPSAGSAATELKSVYEDQAAEQALQLKTARKVWSLVVGLTFGNPNEVEAAQIELSALETKVQENRDAILVPVKAAQDVLDGAIKVVSSVKGEAHFSAGKNWCGADGCEGDCADACNVGDFCFDNYCRCVPDCGEKQCGSDGCGGVCGDHRGGCANDEWCSSEYQCIAYDFEELSCRPSCNKRGSPKRPAGRKVMRTGKDKSIPKWKQRANAFTFGTIAEFVEYLRVLDEYAAQVKEAQAGVLTLAEKIATDKETVADLGGQIKTAAQERKALAKALKKGMPMGEEELPPTKEIVSAKGNELNELKSKKKALETALVASRKVYAKEKKKMARYAKAEGRLQTEILRLRSIENAWRKAKESVVEAESSLKSARSLTEAPLAELEEKFSSELAGARKTVADLTAPAFSDELKAVWECGGPTCPTSSALIRASSEFSLEALVAAVKELHKYRKNGWDAYAKQTKEQKGEQGEKYEKWEDEVTALRICLIYLEELAAANERKLGLRKALHAVREGMAR